MNTKTKLYTRRQISEAIAFWKKILENTSPLIDALVEEFGYDVVFGGKKIVPTLKMLEHIYKIINTYLFDNKLSMCPIEHDRLGKCQEDCAAMEYYDVLYTDSIANPTKYILLTQIGQDADGNVYYPPRIFVSNDFLNSNFSLIAIASILTHEMIHQYIIEVSDGIQKSFNADYKGEKYEIHKGEFANWMSLANSKHGLNVTEKGSKMTYDNDSINALKKFAGYDYAIKESENDIDTFRKIRHENGYVEMRFM